MAIEGRIRATKRTPEFYFIKKPISIKKRLRGIYTQAYYSTIVLFHKRFREKCEYFKVGVG